MAKVVDPLRSSEARGKVGATSYNTWRGLHTVKTCGSPKNQQTAARIEARRKLIYWSKQWQLLTSNQRDAWNSYADHHTRPCWTGQPIRCTGHQLFVGLSVNQERCSALPSGDPPSQPAPNPLSAFASHLEPVTGNVYFDFAVPSAASGLYVDVWQNGPHSAGRMPSIKESCFLLLMPPADEGHVHSTWATILSDPQSPNVPWIDPVNARLEDGVYAYATTPPLGQTDNILATDLDSHLPANSLPLGLQIRLRVKNVSDGFDYASLVLYRPRTTSYHNVMPTDMHSSGPGWTNLVFGGAKELPDSGWLPGDFADPLIRLSFLAYEASGNQQNADLDFIEALLYHQPQAMTSSPPAHGWYTYHARILDSATGLASGWLQTRQEVT